MAFNEEEIIKEKQIIIDNLVTWIWNNSKDKNEFRKALEECNIPEEDIEGYCED